ncbi:MULTISPECIES: SLATT domain-containing protein [Pseudomonas]|uniref:SLATT domain-containing protein n=1 Tax=Pseudomonas wuhanensis TaxID=2954098 RepID=A0ABY9GP83_9PSED|nr:MULTISPECIES: SLATT domain-containing protein [unclassified Pseudomonas]WLI11675.1 SLATT domain-containing protein [Pseudomonas sp. FP603]WLI17516.1 SLATT domain-containing protein [Pseudomonas sp. FP607]
MKKELAQRLIAEKAYDVGYSAKLHFSTYEIVEKGPGWIGFVSICVGILSLIISWLAEKQMSAAVTILGITGMYIAYYSEKKDDYYAVGQKLTALFNKLKKLSMTCESSEKVSAEHLSELENIEHEFNSLCLSKHIFGASWLAHKKFFWEQQIGWIDEHLHFNFFRDKIPLSLYITIFGSLVVVLAVLAFNLDLTDLIDHIQRICTK